MINYDSDRGVTVTDDKDGSTLTLENAVATDSGNYSCSPYNIRPSWVVVHVLTESNSAAAIQEQCYSSIELGLCKNYKSKVPRVYMDPKYYGQ